MEFEIERASCVPNVKPCSQSEPYIYSNDKYIYGHDENGNSVITKVIQEELVGWKINISSLEDLTSFMKEVGKIIIYPEKKGLPLITIYDEHVE